jgi:asparagine synthase (glutamine-hydrolysing)
MCGIVGGFGFNADPSEALNIATLAMRRRGPDGSGRWISEDHRIALGHVRLSIIDPTDAGHQPMLTADQRVVMVFNGEIYNFRELRAELELSGQRFQSHSDSEVLLHLFARYGASCFSRLNGIFAAAFWEQDAELLTLVRDPVGVKPLYISENIDGLVFASEIKALLRSGSVRPELNPQAVLAHLGFLWSPGRDTLVKRVHKVLPGHVVRVKAGYIISDEPYRALRFHRLPAPRSDFAAAQAVSAAVRTAVERQMVSDVPLGAFLSGGLDSSAVAAFAQQYREKEGAGISGRLQCFSIEVEDGSTASEGFADDLPYARRVAKHIGVDLHVVQAGKQMMDRLPEMIYLLDEPTPDPAALNTLLISELASSQGIKVLLSGAGGDDIFTGYRRHFALMQERWWSGWPAPLRAGIARIAEHLPVTNPLMRRIGKAFQYADQDPDHRLVSYFFWANPRQVLDLLNPDFRAGLSAESLYTPMLRTLGELSQSEDSLNRMLYLECKHFLADHNLNYADKMGMAAGIEVRVPLLDLDLMDLAGSLPPDMKQRGRVGKWIFKKAMEPYLPYDIIYRPKTGFGVPLRHWLQTILKPLVDDALSTISLHSRGVFNPVAVQKLRQRHQAGQVDATYTIFSMVCLELWCRQYIDGAYALDTNFESEF